MNTYKTYAEAEKELNKLGYIYETGMPLYGCRFIKANQYAVILRLSAGVYDITI